MKRPAFLRPTALSPAVVGVLSVVVAVVAAVGLYFVSRQPGPGRVALDQYRAEQLAASYRRDTLTRIPNQPRYAEAHRNVSRCGDREHTHEYTIAGRYDLVFGAAGADAGQDGAFTALRGHWQHSGYQVVEDTTGLVRQLLVENPADGFRFGLTQRSGRGLRVTISSPCLVLTAEPVEPVLPAQLAGPRMAYQEYVAEQLAQLTTQVTALRATIAASDLDGSRVAWLAAQLTWEHVGAAYGSFGDLAGAIDGLPNGLPGGVQDPDFTGLHRIEYDLWHEVPSAQVLATADRLLQDVAELGASVPQLTVDPAGLPLRAHEILEDAQRDILSGLTDQGSGAGLAETYADVEATRTVLDELAPLIDARRPGLLGAARASLDNLERVLLATRDNGAWPNPASLPLVVRGQINAAIGGALETLARVPGLLELPTS